MRPAPPTGPFHFKSYREFSEKPLMRALQHKLIFRAILSVLFCYSASAAALEKNELTAEQLFKKLKPAVVKIIVKQQQVPISQGTGFFVGSDGRMITNLHVVRNGLRSGSFSFEFQLDDGTVIRQAQVSRCGDSRGIDLCLMKLAVKPKAFFSLAKGAANPGQIIYAIGHPQGYDFSITNGIVSGLRKDDNKIDELQVSAAINPGNSGGPIFDTHGELLAVATKYLREGQNLSFGIAASEVAAFVKKPGGFLPVADYRKMHDQDVQKIVLQWRAQDIDPARRAIGSTSAFAKIKTLHEVAVHLKEDQFTTSIPEMFKHCEEQTEKSAPAFSCEALGGAALLRFFKLPGRYNKSIMALDDKPVMDEHPLPLVEQLKADGRWAEIEKSLTPENKKFLYSVSSHAHCAKFADNIYPHALFRTGTTECGVEVYNDREADSLSRSIWIQKGDQVYVFYVWMEDRNYLPYFKHVLDIAVDTAHSALQTSRSLASEADAIVDSPFTIKLVSPFHFTGSQRFAKSNSTAFHYTSADGAPNTLRAAFAINHLVRIESKSSIQETAQALFEGASEGYGASFKDSDINSTDLNVDGMSGIEKIALGTKDGQPIGVYHATFVTEDATYMIFGVSSATEWAENKAKFSQMAHSLRRK